jgi:hypothetical protein
MKTQRAIIALNVVTGIAFACLVVGNHDLAVENTELKQSVENVLSADTHLKEADDALAVKANTLETECKPFMAKDPQKFFTFSEFAHASPVVAPRR